MLRVDRGTESFLLPVLMLLWYSHLHFFPVIPAWNVSSRDLRFIHITVGLIKYDLDHADLDSLVVVTKGLGNNFGSRCG